jgi:type VI protein secretion system component VasK
VRSAMENDGVGWTLTPARRAAPSQMIFINIIIKAPIVQILTMLSGFAILNFELPNPLLKGTAVHRSLVLRLVLLLFQTFLAILFYQVCHWFSDMPEGEADAGDRARTRRSTRSSPPSRTGARSCSASRWRTQRRTGAKAGAHERVRPGRDRLPGDRTRFYLPFYCPGRQQHVLCP